MPGWWQAGRRGLLAGSALLAGYTLGGVAPGILAAITALTAFALSHAG
ncbi:hypothetical protein [Actinoplanes auranticolor]|uniref:Uncharacterized protein n=1 Tax=Actinoplanes auranticolor TaxID=47988 RepID=A0A919VPJ1_9ACTN|nr:hypothetical protein [Actinoplanes auranticolor]GIM64078.1 hypothetical protein Aau02nite_08180 [Actinoplanes auranticolor]